MCFKFMLFSILSFILAVMLSGKKDINVSKKKRRKAKEGDEMDCEGDDEDDEEGNQTEMDVGKMLFIHNCLKYIAYLRY